MEVIDPKFPIPSNTQSSSGPPPRQYATRQGERKLKAHATETAVVLALVAPKAIVKVLRRRSLGPLRVLCRLSSTVTISTGTRRSSVTHGLRPIASRRLGLRGSKVALLRTILT